MLKFSKDTSRRSIEDQYAALETGEGAALSLSPSLSTEAGFGTDAALIQFTAAWNRHQASPKLVVPGRPDSSSIQSLAATPHGLAAIYFATQLEFRGPPVTVTEESEKFLIPSVDAAQRWELGKTMKAAGVHLSCLGGTRNEFILPLYSNETAESLRTAQGFRHLTQLIFAAFARHQVRMMREGDLTLISVLLRELFQNAHDHARFDEKGAGYKRNQRGIIAREFRYRGTQDNVIGYEVLNRYFGRIAARKKHYRANPALTKERFEAVIAGAPSAGKQQPSTKFFEITVYDSGPGLARHWAWRKSRETLQNLSIDEEFLLVKQCFEVHNTTKFGHGFGEGLTGALGCLRRLRAFMLLRTGRLTVYQDFSSDDAGELKMLDHGQDVPGTSYTLAIPIGINIR